MTLSKSDLSITLFCNRLPNILNSITFEIKVLSTNLFVSTVMVMIHVPLVAYIYRYHSWEGFIKVFAEDTLIMLV